VGLGYGPVAVTCEYGSKPSDCIKGGKFLDQLSYLASQEGFWSVELIIYSVASVRLVRKFVISKHTNSA